MSQVQSQHSYVLQAAFFQGLLLPALTAGTWQTTACAVFICGLFNGWLIRTEHNELHGTWKWSWRPWDTISTSGEINGNTAPLGRQSVPLQKNGTGNLPNTRLKYYCYSWLARLQSLLKNLIVAYLSAGYGHYTVPIKWIEFTSFNFNIILPFMPNSYKWHLPFRLFNQHSIVLFSNPNFIILKWIPVTTECRVLSLRSEETASRYRGYSK